MNGRLRRLYRRGEGFAKGLTPGFYMCLAAGFLVLGLVATHLVHSYTSDDVVVQNIVNNWSVHDKHFVVGPQTFALKAPLYVLLRFVASGTRQTLLGIALFQNLVGFALYGLSVYLLLGRRLSKRPVAWLSVVWLTSLGSFFYTLLINPNTRNMEIGLAFLVFTLAYLYVQGRLVLKTRWHYVLAAAVVGLFSLLLFSDAYFMYFFCGPWLLALAICWFYGPKQAAIQKRTLFVVGGILLAVVGTKFWQVFFGKLGMAHNSAIASQFASIDTLFGNNIPLSLKGLFSLFNADFFGLKAASFPVLVAGLNMVVIALLVMYTVRQFMKYVVRGDVLRVFMVLVVVCGIVLYTFSATPTEILNTRYMILVPFALVFLLADMLSATRARTLLPVLILAVVGNMAMLTLTNTFAPDSYMVSETTRYSNQKEANIIKTLRANNVHVGYGGYWNAGSVTYLSDNTIRVIPLECQGKNMAPFSWYVQQSLFVRREARMFLIDTDRDTRACIDKSEYQAFGHLTKTIRVDERTNILIFDTIQPQKGPWEREAELAKEGNAKRHED